MSALARLRDALPAGKTLPPDVWARRHRAMVVVIWAHAIAMPIYGLTRGFPLWHSLLEGLPIATFGAAAYVPYRSERFRACMVALGLLSSSAVMVHISGGSIEAHFHFFVMVTLLACYEEWTPYLLAILFVLLHHGVMGAIDPSSVFNHGTTVTDPWKWASIHALFITALCVVNVISWRMNEDARAERAEALERTQASEAQFRGTFEGAPIGMAIVALDGRLLRVNRSLCAMTGYSEERMLAMNAQDFGPGGRDENWGNAEGEDREVSYPRADGSTGWVLWQRSLLHGV